MSSGGLDADEAHYRIRANSQLQLPGAAAASSRLPSGSRGHSRSPSRCLAPPVSAVPFPLLPQPPTTLLEKVLLIMQRGAVFTKYSYSTGAPKLCFVFFAAGATDSGHAADADITFGNIYWNSEMDFAAHAEDEAKEEAEAAAETKARLAAKREKKEEKDKPNEDEEKLAAAAVIPPPRADRAERHRQKYARSCLRCLPLVSVIQVRTGSERNAATAARAAQPVVPLDPWEEPKPRSPEAAAAAPRASRLGSGFSSPTSPSSAQPPGFPSHALSQSFGRWTLQPALNVETFRHAQRRRRERRKARRKAIRHKKLAGVHVKPEEEVSSDSDEEGDEWRLAGGAPDDDEEDEDDWPAYTYHPPPLSHCFSVATADRTLDLVARDAATRDTWVFGLRWLAARADTYFNHQGGLGVEASQGAQRMSVAQALEQTQAMRDRLKQQQKEAGILWKIRALWTRPATTPMAPPTRAASAVTASPANGANSSMLQFLRSASDPVRSRPVSLSSSLPPPSSASSSSSSSLPTRLSRELGCELRISARHLASPSKLASGTFAPCVIVYGVQRKQTAAAAATASAKSKSGTRNGSDIRGAGFASGERAVFIGRTERISDAQCLSSSTFSSSGMFSFPASSARSRGGGSAPLSLNPSHPNFLSVLTLTRMDEFDEFHLVVHDTADILSIEAAAAARHALNSGGAHSSATGSAETSRTSSRIPSRRPSVNRTASGEANAAVAAALSSPSAAASSSSSPSAPLLFSLHSLQLCPIVGWCRFRADDFLLNFGRELVSPLGVPGAPPSIALLTKHFLAPLPTARSVKMLTKAASSASRNNTASRTSVGNGGGGGGGDWLLASAGAASDDLFVRDSEGRTLVTDAMLDAYKVAVFDREARREQKQVAAALATELAARQGSGAPPLSALDRQASVAAASLTPLSTVRAQINPLLLLRVRPISSLRSSQPARQLSGGVTFTLPGGLDNATSSAAAYAASEMAAHESELRMQRRMMHRTPLIHASAHLRSLSQPPPPSDEEDRASRHRRGRHRAHRRARRHTWAGFEAGAHHDKILIATTAKQGATDSQGEEEEQQEEEQRGGGEGTRSQPAAAAAMSAPLSLTAAPSSSSSSPLLVPHGSVIEDLELDV